MDSFEKTVLLSLLIKMKWDRKHEELIIEKEPLYGVNELSIMQKALMSSRYISELPVIEEPFWIFIYSNNGDELNITNGYAHKKFNELILGGKKSYRLFNAEKKDGRYRRLLIPEFYLRRMQKQIYKNILLLLDVHPCAKAYKKGSSLKNAAVIHTSKNNLLRLDIKHFFDSISYKRVLDVFENKCGYNHRVACALAGLCTYQQKYLPQGASTSPALSNIIFYDIDEKINEFCIARNISYSRYCDDMFFSGDFSSNEIIVFVKELLNKNGFYLNFEKTSFMKKLKGKT